jgi:3-oxoacyl-[acyl-carrier-protein] synthase II
LNETLAAHGFKKVQVKNLISVNAACASGNQTLGIAMEGIRSGRWKRCLVGGVDARCEPSNLLNFLSLGALTNADVDPSQASRPFSKDRTGFVRGEGAALILLESEEAAMERKAPILGNVLGYGATSDAYRLTDGREDGLAVIEAMNAAIQDAGLKPSDISYVNAHGTSTPLNDRLETSAIKEVFGELAYKIPISSIKSKIGHSTIAASSIEAIACLMMLDEQKISPTLNLEVPDPECDLDYVPHVARDAKLDYVLSNSFGFGGQNTCLVLSRSKG